MCDNFFVTMDSDPGLSTHNKTSKGPPPASRHSELAQGLMRRFFWVNKKKEMLRGL
jgi:hypothetical protein